MRRDDLRGADAAAHDPTGEAIDGERAAQRLVRAIRDSFAPPDAVMHDLQNLLELEGRILPASPRLRAWCSAIRKALEQR